MKKQTIWWSKGLNILVLTSMVSLSISGCALPPNANNLSQLNTDSSVKNNTYPITKSDIFFDTVISVTLYDYSGNSSEILSGAMDICKKYENLFSSTVQGSDIWNINHSKGQPVSVSNETYDLLKKAIDYCILSDGKLDVTLGGVSKLWDFSNQSGSDNPIVPSSEDITGALSHVDYSQVKLSATDTGEYTVTLADNKAQLELGFIAKGYIADSLYDYLKEKEVTSAIINLGGNVKVVGSKPDGSDFSIGIQKPFGEMGESITSVKCSDTSVVSSGVYERYFKVDNQLYHHILDSATGYPYENNLYSASIKTFSSTDADALSTLCFILGVDEGLKYIESLPATEVMFITKDYEIITSSGW